MKRINGVFYLRNIKNYGKTIIIEESIDILGWVKNQDFKGRPLNDSWKRIYSSEGFAFQNENRLRKTVGVVSHYERDFSVRVSVTNKLTTQTR